MSSVITVSQLNRYLASKLRSDLKLKGIAVKGEISNFNIHYKSGHAYFTVKDSSSALKAVMFSSSVSRLKFVPEDGMSVLVMGNIEVRRSHLLVWALCTFSSNRPRKSLKKWAYLM